MNKNKKIVFGLIVGAIAVFIMFFTTMPSAGSKELPISEILQNSAEYESEYLMTSGLLNNETIKWDADKILLEFELYEEDKEKEMLSVQYEGVKPDNFTDDVIVIVEGTLNEEGVFLARTVQTKCPSKYEGEDMDNYDIETHKKILKDSQEE